MRAWRFTAGSLRCPQRVPTRLFTTHTRDDIRVRCGSAGAVTVELLNVGNHSPTSPLFIYLPPYSPAPTDAVSIPSFLQPWPVALVRYRWSNGQTLPGYDRPFQWPTPVHDTAFAFSWILDNLAPERLGKRQLFILGSHLGASLATSLGLTQCHSHATRLGVRGVIAYNGIYNWTMFLPDHKINQPASRGRKAAAATPPPQPKEGSRLHRIQQSLPDLFGKPADMFDPFASPSLFFHGPGLHVPQSFHTSHAEQHAIDALANPDDPLRSLPLPAPRRSHLVFPPRKSTLKIPETLLIHNAPNLAPETSRRRSRRAGHSFREQAGELAGFMRRSVDKVELKMRSAWDDDMGGWEEEAARRVRVVDVGEESDGLSLPASGEQAVHAWLKDVM